MTIPLTGSGSLFVRLGHLYGQVEAINALRESFASAVIGTISPDYADGTPLPQVIYDAQTTVTALQSGAGGAISSLIAEAQRTLYAMVNVDTQGVSADASLSQLVQGQSAQSAVQALINQMVIGSDYLQPATVTAGSQTSVGSPNGNPIILLSLKNPRGVTWQLAFPEVLTFTCTRDSQSGGATLGNESLLARGQTSVTDPLSQLWPGGSAASATLTAVTAGASGTLNNNSAGTKLVNGAFLNFTTSNVADNFTILAGTAGTQILNGAGTSYLTGAGSIEFVGNATGASIAQSFGVTPSTTVGAGGTGYALTPDTVMHGVLFYKLSAGSPAAGVLTVDLVDGSNTVIADDASTNNTAAVTLSGVGDALWHALTFAFRTPAILPTTSPVGKLRIRLSTPLSVGTNVYISNVTLTNPTAIYAGGPWASVHAGSSKLIAGAAPDTFTITVSNNYQSSGTGLMQSYLQRTFNLLGLGLQLPVSGSNQIPDSLIS